jgi:DNA topoisomerase VI subunit A
MQNDNVASKSSKTSYLFKKYTLPSGKIINIQGYENYALDKMFKDNVKEDDICFIKKEVPIIWYEENNKKHRHYVDFFIKSLNKCIEVKSIWTFEKKQNNVLIKQNASKKIGYLYEIWIFEPNGNLNKIIY